MSDKLLPCPFCGSEARIEVKQHSGDHYIMCPVCRTRQNNITAKEKAINLWNSRATIGSEEVKRVMNAHEAEVKKLMDEQKILKGDIANLQQGRHDLENKNTDLQLQINNHESVKAKNKVLRKKVERLEREVTEARSHAFKKYQQEEGW